MLRVREIRVPLDYSRDTLRDAAARRLKVSAEEIVSFEVRKKAVDARRKSDVHFNFTLDVKLKDERGTLRKNRGTPGVTGVDKTSYQMPLPGKFSSHPVVVGSGPAGMFAALWLAAAGAQPVLLERGLDVEAREKTVERFWLTGELDEECNVQFGEGGAGTFSDGKLTTGTHDARIGAVLETFCGFGAPEDILYSSKPHIGTDMLRRVVKAMRERTQALGGRVIFGARFCGISIRNGRVAAVEYEKNGVREKFDTDTLVLAVGHSARDVFELLSDLKIALEPKPFSVGVRIEHLQSDIDKAMFGGFAGHPALGAADYKLACHLPDGRGVYTFCMCPGGRVVAAASEKGALAVNGMSYRARDMENANSALLVGLGTKDFDSGYPLAGVEFQRMIEKAAFAAGGGDYRAPVTTVGAFLKGGGAELGRVAPSYLPGVRYAEPERYLPAFVTDSLRAAIAEFGRKIAGFDAPDAVLTGVESRSSSPVRILRGADCVSPSLKGLYPCGEGAGYAGGIVSAAVDGIRCAEAVIKNLK